MRGILEENISNLRKLIDDVSLQNRIDDAINLVVKVLKLKSPLLLFGNGGSASDALHISGELVGKFNFERESLNVICLNANVTVLTAWANDFSYDDVFARQVEAHGLKGGVAWGLTTSGNSPSVVNALKRAQDLGLQTIAMTGIGGGNASSYTDILIDVPSQTTPRIQEMHLPIYHYMCAEIEKKMK